MMDQELFSLLVSQTLQVTLLALVVWSVTRIFARNRPHLAHALWILVLLKCVTPPIWCSPASPFTWIASRSIPASTNRSNEGSDSAGSVSYVIENPAELLSRPAGLELAFPEASWQPTHVAGTELSQGEWGDADPVSNPTAVDWPAWIVAIWMSSAGSALLLSLFQFGRFLVWLRRSPIGQYPELELELQRLARSLKIRRRVQLRVLQAPVGPAVLGWIRPTVLLPESIVAGKTQTQLAPLLAHELVHIRRGDLGWACVQTIAKSLFWFHPLVRFAAAMVTRESERSCDEETVASLGCTPATYARGLLEVLEHKHRLRVAPALPGVRPLDITSARLERVMKLGHGSCRRTPVWVWFVMLVCGATVLPGASMIVAQENSKNAGREILDSPIADSPTRLRWPMIQTTESTGGQRLPVRLSGQTPQARESADDGQQWMLKTFDVANIMSKIRAANLKSPPEQRLFQELPCGAPDQPGLSTSQGRGIRFVTDDGEVYLGRGAPSIKIVNDKMYVFNTKGAIKEIERTVNRLNEHGFKQVEVECRFGVMPRASLDNLGIQWSIGHSAVAPLTNPANNVTDDTVNATYLDVDQAHAMAPVNVGQGRQHSPVRAASFVEKSSPVLYALIDDDEFSDLVKRFQNVPDSSLLSAPRVRMLCGQSAQVSAGTTRPFVVGLNRVEDGDGKESEALQPVIRMISDGSTFNMNAKSNADNSVDLDCLLSLSKVLSVDTAEVPVETGKGKAKIQIPEVATSQIHSSMRIPNGKTLVLGSFRDGDDGQKEAFLAIIKCQSFDGVSVVPASITKPDNGATERRPVDTKGPYQEMNPARASDLKNEDGPRYLVPTNDQPGPIRVVNHSDRLLESQGSVESGSGEIENDGLTATRHFLVRSGDRSDSNVDYQPLRDVLKKYSIDLRIEGNVNFEIKNDRVLISANKFSFGRDTQREFPGKAFQVSADQGRLEFMLGPKGIDVELKLTGKAKLLEDELITSADEIEYVEGVKLEMRGNATAASDQFQLQAQRVSFNHGAEGVIYLEGGARLETPRKTKVHAERIKWNTCTDAFTYHGVVDLTLRRK